MISNEPIENLLLALRERAKELNCLYEIQELLGKPAKNIEDVCKGIVKAIPPGWQFPDVCEARIYYRDQVISSSDFKETDWQQCASIKVQDEVVGKICVFYTEERPQADEGPFLKEERKLIETIAEQFGLYILHHQLKTIFEEEKKQKLSDKSEWNIIIDLLKQTDPKLLIRISRKMVNYLCWSGFKEAEKLLENFSPAYKEEMELLNEANRPYQRKPSSNLLELSYTIFNVAGKYLSETEVINSIQKWIKEDHSGFLVNILEDTGSSLAEISSAIERYHHLVPHGMELSTPREMSFRVALIRRLLSDHPSFMNVAKHFIYVDNFNEILHRIIYPVGSHGKLGGKSSGLFLAENVIRKSSKENKLLNEVKIPKTWYLTSDGIVNFMSNNNLEDIMEQKYKDIGQVRQEYPYVVHVFKNSQFAPEIIQGLSHALDDLGEVPLIIRSSSLLEDRLGAAFAGKYKSLFIANQGSKEERLAELLDAIAEVYASIFAPDPIEYRTEHGLQDYHEEMGIMIQEVVGKKIGKYFFPAFGGVAFSQNEFRWSSRIKREDGLIRVVAGLGTRAVDRLSDDYPILVAPGQPGLRVNVSLDEIVRYSPKKIDMINLETRTFETIEISQLLKEVGSDFPLISKIVSLIKEDHISQPRLLGLNFESDNFVVTFDGLIKDTPFIEQIHSILQLLQTRYNHPIDIEFAHDGKDFYLLQCRSQSFSDESKPAKIPKDIEKKDILFTAERYISNGIVPNISHIVYVDPQKYAEISGYQELVKVARAIGRLNKILPKRRFILMGPGRWGSRGDIKLGVSITYSEINNTAMLIEIARQQKDYVPDLSFGTHFFQDLVEANIRYLPLYPDDKGIIFNEKFFNNSPNVFSDMLPDFAFLTDVIRVIDVNAVSGERVVNVLMNGEKGEALAFLAQPTESKDNEVLKKETIEGLYKTDIHWRWRMRCAENIAAHLDARQFGVKAFYLFGSTKNASAGPESDINLLIHFNGNEQQRHDLLTWLDGWSLSLAQTNFFRTGHKTGHLLDVHLICDEDIKNKTSWAQKINAVTDPARPLAMGAALK